MKNYIALGMLASFAMTVAAPAFADEADKSVHNSHKAHRQEEKAAADAAAGNVAGAEKHQAEARHDRHKAHHEAKKAAEGQ
ncbi:MAG TPA: hypothetical protein V6C81_27660 [Planktothrix sp.]